MATLDKKIMDFTRAYRRWILDVADELINSSTCGRQGNPSVADSPFAVLFLLLSYFEMIAKLKAGYVELKESGTYFKKGLHDVLPETVAYSADDMNRLYQKVRCGFYHAGLLLDNDVVVTGETPLPIVIEGQRIKFNPSRLVCCVKKHFDQCEAHLSNPQNGQLRINFESWFDANFAR